MRLGPNGPRAWANVSILSREHRIADGLRLGREAGFRYVEAWWPFASRLLDEARVHQCLGGLDYARAALDPGFDWVDGFRRSAKAGAQQ